MTTARPRLVIHHLRSEYLVPADHPRPQTLRARLDNVVETKLSRALGGVLEQGVGAAPGLCLIDRLHCEVDLDCDGDADALARRWAGRIGTALDRAIRDGDGVVFFADYAEFLARFLCDLAAGRAWRQWYYRRFDGLRVLPPPIALRTAVLESPEVGLRALLALGDSERRSVVDLLGDTEARRVVSSLARDVPTPAVDEAAGLDALLALVAGTPAPWSAHRSPWRLVLEWYVDLARRSMVWTGMLELLVAAAAIRCAPDAAFDPGADHAHPGVLPTLPGIADSDLTAVLRELSPDRRRQLLSAARGHVTRLAPARRDGFLQDHTAYGGAFLLLPIVNRLLDSSFLFDAGWAAADTADGATAAHRRAALMLLLLAKAHGPADAESVFADPVLRTLLEVPPQRDWAQTAAFCAAVPEELWRELTASIGRKRLAERPERLQQVTLCRGEGPETFYVEARRGVCIYGEGRALPVPPAWLLDHADKPPGVARAGKRALLHDLRYLGSRHEAAPEATADLYLALIAQGVIREFSSRLTGFNASPCAVLRRDFLSFPAAVEETDTMYRVSLGRPPLNIVLNMTSMQRERFRLTSADKDIAVFPGE